MVKKRQRTDVRAVLRRALLSAGALTIVGFFGAYAVMGPNGALAYGDYKRQLARKDGEFAKLEARRAVLQNRVALLDPRHANPDLVDELVRRDLNVSHPDEVIVPLPR